MACLENVSLLTTKVAVSTSIAPLVPARPDRRFLAVENTGTGAVTVSSKPDAAAGDGWVLGPAGGALGEGGKLILHDPAPNNALYVIGAAASTITVMEG